MKQIPFITNKIRLFASSFVDDPDLKDFAQGSSTFEKEIGRGYNKPRIHKFESGHRAVTKSDIDSIVFEPLGYEIGKKLGLNVPRTVVRNLSDPYGNVVPHSVQEFHPGETGYEILKKRFGSGKGIGTLSGHPQEVLDHPMMHKSVLSNFLIGNDDMHNNNYLYDHETGNMSNIDNGYMLDYDPTERRRDKSGNVVNADLGTSIFRNIQAIPDHHLIPADFRQAILQADPKEHEAIIRKYLATPEGREALRLRQKINGYGHGVRGTVLEYFDRMNTLKRHFSDPRVRIMGDIKQKLYPY